MGYVKGVVERISIGTPIEPKNPDWGKSAKLGLQIEGKWWNGFVSQDKRDGTFKAKDKDYNVITEGCTVEFMTEDKNGYENIDKKTMRLLNGGGTGTPQATNTHQTTTNTTPQENVAKNEDKSLTDAFCYGVASMIAAYKFKGKTPPDQHLINKASDYIKKLLA